VPAVVFLVNAIPPLGGESSLWLALAATSTFAGNLTIIGSVANLIVFEGARDEAKVGFWEYFRAGAPLAVVLVLASALWLAWLG
jgi:Na+/H+ antiporter NhaD/arsenite permease-like protein